jgi:hypothetical protein
MTPGESLMARLGLDTSGFKAGMKDAHSSFQSLVRTMGVGLSAAGVAGYSREIAEYAARVEGLSKAYRVSTTDVQRWGNAADKNNSSMEEVTRGLGKLEVSVARALGGNSKILKSFNDLGISVEDLQTLSPDALMRKIGNSSMNAADLVTVLGKSGQRLIPVLKSVADGSIELGDALENSTIKQLKKADDQLKTFHEHLRIFAGQGLSAFSLNMKGIAVDAEAAWNAIKFGFKGDNFFSMPDQMMAMRRLKEIASGGGPSKKMWEEYETDRARGMVADLHTPMELRNPATKEEPPKSKSDLAAEKKERERDQLSLKDLAEKGPHSAFNQGDYYVQSNGTAQMIYAAQQARLVEQLEAQAKRVRLSGVSATGETSASLLGRADAIRQTLPIKESEKEVGIYATALKQSLSGVEEKLDNIEAQLE